MYLAIQGFQMGSVLGQYDDTRRKELVIYYLIETFVEYETRYISTGKDLLRIGLGHSNVTPLHIISYHSIDSREDPLKYLIEKPIYLGDYCGGNYY